MSDGTNVLYVLEPNTFTVLKQIEVFDNVRAITNLNELEYIDGKIYANVYLTNEIVIINPETGKVEGKIDLTQITPQKYRNEHDLVLNGIAYNKQNNKLYITGKRWDVLFEIKLDNQ
jgi:glutamine cyclotransferase